jgi:hypothetical protein
MVTGAGRALTPVGLAIFPSAMRWIANSTRIPERALVQTRAVMEAERKKAFP